jgi:acylpyruvate hydrolase
MRLATIRTVDGTRAVRVDGDQAVELDAPDVGAVLAASGGSLDAAGTGSVGALHRLDDVDYAPLVTQPGKIICLGLNYEAHIRETGQEPPKYPTLFAKFADALIGARDPIVLPRVSTNVDWEVELAFVIGRTARHVNAADALDHVAGFTVLNDVSVRDYQRRTQQWLQGKCFEHSTPVGPVLVTPDELGDLDLRVTCEVDGVLHQDARTSDLVFDPAAVVAYVSEITTLRPGDLISTGTPGGVAAAQKPPPWLQPGQMVRTAIEGIGELVNECVPEGGG